MSQVRPVFDSRLVDSGWTVAKVAASLGLLLFLGSRAADDIHKVLDISVRMPLLLAAFGLLLVVVFINAQRWALFARAVGLALSLVAATRLTFASLFASQVMPGLMGLDVVRGAAACWIGLPARPVIVSIVADRLASSIGSAVLGAASLPLMVMRVGSEAAILVALPYAGLVVAPLLLVHADRIPLFDRLAGGWARRPLETLSASRHALVSRSGFVAVILAIVVQILSIAALVLLARGIGISATLEDGLIVLPTALLLASLPISMNGWGVREGAVVYGFGLLGFAGPHVFTLSVLFGLGVVLSSLPGGILWLSLRKSPRESRDAAVPPIARTS